MIDLYNLVKEVNAENVQKIDDLIYCGKLNFGEVVNTILDSKNSKLIYLAGKYISDMPMGRLGHALAKLGNSIYIYKFAFLEGAPINELARGIIATRNHSLIYEFARDVNNAPIDLLAKAMIEIETKSFTYSMDLFYFLRDLHDKMAPDTAKSMANRVIEFNEPAAICAIASMNILPLQDCITGLKKCKVELASPYFYLIAYENDLDFLQIHDMARVLLKSNDYIYIVKFILDIPGSPYEQMIDYLAYDQEKGLRFLINLAISNHECAEYAVDKIIESGNRELIECALASVEDLVLQGKLRNGLNKILSEEMSQKRERVSLGA